VAVLRRRATILVSAVLLAAAAHAPAAMAAPRAEAAASLRSEATRLLALDRRYDRDLEPRILRVIERLGPALEDCSPGPEDSPARAQEEAVRRATSLLFRHAVLRFDDDIDRIVRSFQRFRARSGSVRDAARAAARVYRIFQRLSQSPPDVCGYWPAWGGADWATSFRIGPPTPNPTSADIRAAERAHRTIRRAARVFRRHRVRRSHVSRFVESYDVAGQLRVLSL
jgi:hypothetical protein